MDCADEYQRLLLIKQILWATGLTLVISQFWPFVQHWAQQEDAESNIGSASFPLTVIWFLFVALCGLVIRRRG